MVPVPSVGAMNGQTATLAISKPYLATPIRSVLVCLSLEQAELLLLKFVSYHAIAIIRLQWWSCQVDDFLHSLQMYSFLTSTDF